MSIRFEADPAAMKRVREGMGLTIEEAAALVGLEPHQLEGVEKGYRALTPKQADRIVKAYSLEAEDKKGGEVYATPLPPTEP